MPPDTEDYVGYLISDVARLMRTVFDRRVRALGLTRAQWLVLSRLHRRPGASQSELADMLEVEKATAGRLLDRLEVKGWVERRPDRADRRVNRLHLTPRAQAMQAAMWDIAETTVDDALASLSPAERDQFSGLLGRVKRRLLVMAEGDPAPPSAAPDR